MALPALLLVLDPAGSRAEGTTDLSGPGSALAELRGEQVYRRACAACHGVTGDGNGAAARELDPRPRDFTRGTYKFRSTPSGELPTDEDLLLTIRRGIPSTLMPAWAGLLADEEMRDVVAYVKTFSSAFEEYESVPPITITPEPQLTPETIAEGKHLYVIMQCWKCHGAEGRGNGPAADTLVDDWGFKIRAYDFTRGNHKAGSDSRSVYRTFNTGLDSTPMPSYAEVFLFDRESISDFSHLTAVYSRSEIEALRAYIGAQSGEEEFDAMSGEALQAVVERRKWALVHFVSSLSRGKGLFYRLFVEDTELTRP